MFLLFFLRWGWRFATLMLIIALAYVSERFVWRWLDKSLPIGGVIFVMYLVVAYGLIPFVIRFWRIVFKPHHIPRYVTTGDGWPADPVNIAIIAKNQQHFQRAMQKAGWHPNDKATLKNSFHEAYALIFDQPYLTAPFSTFYLFGRPFDLGFQIPYGKNKSPRHRHHVRFWQLVDLPGAKDDTHHAYWFERIRHLFSSRSTVWIGAAIDDVAPLGFRWRDLQLTHKNSAEHTLERDYIIDTLTNHGLVKSVSEVKDGEPFRMRSQNIGTTFVVDGYIKVVTLK
jgi:hypothetical protein